MKIELAEARKCPECKKDGAVANRRPIEGGTLVNFQCENEVCPWYETQWLCELDSDGKVNVNEKAYMAANSQREMYKKPDPTFAANHEAVHRALAGQLQQETQGGEVRPQ